MRLIFKLVFSGCDFYSTSLQIWSDLSYQFISLQSKFVSAMHETQLRFVQILVTLHKKRGSFLFFCHLRIIISLVYSMHIPSLIMSILPPCFLAACRMNTLVTVAGYNTSVA